MRISHRLATTRVAVAVGLAVLAVAAAACGSTSSASTVSPRPSAAASSPAAQSATAAVKQAWQTFFAGTTPAAQKIALLQNGQGFATVIRAQASSPISKATQARVTSVKMVSSDKAIVTYSIIQGGQVALPNQTGQAVLQNGTWKVGARSFQALLQLEQGQGQGGASASPSP